MSRSPRIAVADGVHSSPEKERVMMRFVLGFAAVLGLCVAGAGGRPEGGVHPRRDKPGGSPPPPDPRSNISAGRVS